MIDPTPREIFFELIESEKKSKQRSIEFQRGALVGNLNRAQIGLGNAYQLAKLEVEVHLLNQISTNGEGASNLSDIQVITSIVHTLNNFLFDLQGKVLGNHHTDRHKQEALLAVLTRVMWALREWTAEIGGE